MNKKSIAILLFASTFTSSVFATSIINKLITKYSLVTPKTHKTTKQTNRSYTNFSGTWLAVCENDVPRPVVIENDANYINLGGNEYRIGQGLQGRTESNEQYSSYEHGSFEWNADGSVLTMKSVTVSKDNVDNSTIETDVDTFTLTMKNNQINVDGKFFMFEDVTQSEPLTVHCVLSKKQ